MLIAKFLTDSAWFFFIFWLPKYLADVRHLNIKEIGYYAWIPYAFAGAGSFIGGWLSSHLIRRNYSIDAARKIALATSALLMPVSLGIIAAPLSIAIEETDPTRHLLAHCERRRILKMSSADFDYGCEFLCFSSI